MPVIKNICYSWRDTMTCKFGPNCKYVHISHMQGGSSSYSGNALMETDDLELLSSLVKSRQVSLVPSGDHDDVYILSYAREHRGYVVSNDLFNDHINSLSSDEQKDNIRLFLQHHRCGFTFVDDEIILNPHSGLTEFLDYSSL